MNEAIRETTGNTTLPKLVVDKFTADTTTLLALGGTIDEQFDGKKLAATLKGRTLVLDLGEVRKISSFGVREWVDFVRAAGERFESVILVECSPKVVDQLNMVMNFAGVGRVFSFYAPYRCDYCDADRRVLLQLDRDFDAIRSLKPPAGPCPSCGHPEYLDEDAASYFSYVAQQPRFELDQQVAAFLATRLNYSVEGGARRFRVEKHVEGRATFLRLSGDLDNAFPRDKVADGLEGSVVIDVRAVGKIDPAGAASWRAFLAQLSLVCEHVVLVSCPPAFLERLSRAEDLGKAQVLSFAMPYTCARCGATSAHVIDVAEHFDVVKFATPPEMTCPDCEGPTTCAASEALLAHLGALSQPNVPDELRDFITEAQAKKTEAAAVAVPVVAPASRTTLLTVLVAAAAAAVVAVGVVLAILYLKGQQRAVVAGGLGPPLERSAAARPAWVTSDSPGFASCRNTGSAGLTCGGFAMALTDRAAAQDDALDAAYDELVNSLALGPELAGEVALYAPERQKMLAALGKGRSGSEADAVERLTRARRVAVVKALRATGGAAVPAQPARSYWESYAEQTTLAWAEIDVRPEVVEALRQVYTTPSEALGARALTLFPGLAWRWPDVTGGAYLDRVDDGPLRATGLSAQDVVLEVQGKRVNDAPGFAAELQGEAARLQQAGGAIRLTVKNGDGEPRTFGLSIARAVVTAPPTPERPAHPGTGSSTSGGSGGVNVWDKTGGGAGHDNPNQ